MNLCGSSRLDTQRYHTSTAEMPSVCSSGSKFVHFKKRRSVCRWVVWATMLTVLKDQIYCRFWTEKNKLKVLVLKGHLLILSIYNSWVKIFITLLPMGYFWIFCWEGALPVTFTTFFSPRERKFQVIFLFTLFIDALNLFPGYHRKFQ